MFNAFSRYSLLELCGRRALGPFLPCSSCVAPLRCRCRRAVAPMGVLGQTLDAYGVVRHVHEMCAIAMVRLGVARPPHNANKPPILKPSHLGETSSRCQFCTSGNLVSTRIAESCHLSLSFREMRPAGLKTRVECGTSEKTQYQRRKEV